MAELRTDLSLRSCDPCDHATQRCRLAPSLMDSLDIRIGSCLKVQLADKIFICKACPRHDGLQEAIQIDPFIHIKDVTVAADSQSLKPQSVNKSNLQTVKVSRLSKIEVTLVCARVSDVRKYNIHKESNGKAEYVSLQSLCEYIRNTLWNMYITKHAIVDCTNSKLGKLYGFSYIVINTTSPNKSNSCGLINSQTSILIRNILSKDRFEQRQISTNLKLGGLNAQFAALADLVSFPAQYAESALKLGVSWPQGVLLHGPLGCGKTSLVKVVTSHLDAHLVVVNGAEVFGSRPGEGENNLRELFQKAAGLSEETTCVLFIDELDVLCPKQGRGGTGGMQERRMVAQLANLMDTCKQWRHLMVVGATSRPQVLDPTLRRPGRFEKEIFIGVPSCSQRHEILECLLIGLTIEDDLDLDQLAAATPGFVGADLRSLTDQAHYRAAVDSHGPRSIQMADLQKTLQSLVPSTQRGSDILVDQRPVHWTDIGGLDDVKLQIKQAVEWPMKHSKAFRRLGIKRPSGILLYGPPGCAKTLLVRAAATATGSTFLSVSGAQLHSPFVGDAEKKLAEVFRQARAGAPTILFLDEVDAVMGKRAEESKSSSAHERALSTLLNEMDGVGLRLEHVTKDNRSRDLLEGQHAGHSVLQEGSPLSDAVDNSSVLVVAATNRPDMIDAALLRPGRLDRIIYIPPPDEQARHEIIKVHTRDMPLEGVNLTDVAIATDGFTGADLENLCREAALHALTVRGLDTDHMTQSDFSAALAATGPSLTKAQLEEYAALYPSRRSHSCNAATDSNRGTGLDFSKAEPPTGTFNFAKVV